jgi:hypothetical protein
VNTLTLFDIGDAEILEKKTGFEAGCIKFH